MAHPAQRFSGAKIRPLKSSPLLHVSVTESRERIPELDGVRGIAILLVLVWHFVGAPLGQLPGPAAQLVQRILGIAGSGVDLFFVLSGFLIGGILLDHRTSPRYFRAFYARRLTRILPLYFVWLGLFFVLVAAFPHFTASPAVRPIFADPLPAWSYATFTQNLVMARQETLGPAWLGITWSLAIEEQFYLLLPLMIRFIAPVRLPFACAVLILAAPVFRLVGDRHGIYGGFVIMPCRADSLLLGVLCAILLRRQGVRDVILQWRSGLYGLLVALSSGVVASCFLPLRFGYGSYFLLAFAVLYTSFLLLAVTERRGPVTWIVRNRFLRWLGILAYGVYLFHQAINGLAHGLVLGRQPRFGSLAEIAVTLGAVAVTLSLALLSWRFFEKPLVTWGRSVRYETGAGASPAAAQVALLL
jgi:peptidoglycan/LPS O-acetylase OafA/YrhL